MALVTTPFHLVTPPMHLPLQSFLNKNIRMCRPGTELPGMRLPLPREHLGCITTDIGLVMLLQVQVLVSYQPSYLTLFIPD
ncbi:hypothetical protein D3C86_1653430 [compost metagenome]